MRFIKPFTNTGKYELKMTQSGIDRIKVDQLKNSMKSNSFDFTINSNRIGFEVFNNTFYITEGHHRMHAALEIWKETNDYSFVEGLILNGLRYTISKCPISYRFNI